MTAYDTIVIGGGVIGSCVARELASDRAVLLVEKDQIAGSAAGHAAGFVSDWWAHEGIGHPGSHRLMTEFFPEFDGTGRFSFTERPFLLFVDSEAAVDLRRDEGELLEGFSYYPPSEIESRWPDTFEIDGTAGAIVDERAGFVDPHSFTVALADDADRRGATIRTGETVTGIRTEDGAVDGVEIDGNEVVSAETVVVAAGSHTRDLVADFVDLPTRSFTFSNAEVELEASPGETFPMAFADHVYWRPEESGNLFVSGGEYWLEERTRGPPGVPSEFRREVADVLSRYLNDTAGMRYVSGAEHTCPEGVTIAPDMTPIVDRLDRPDGLVIVDGVYGGIATAPAYAAAVRALIDGDELPFPLDPFRSDRFDSMSLEFDLDHISELP